MKETENQIFIIQKAIKLISTLNEKTFPFCKIEIHISQKLTQAVIAENQIGRALNILNLEGIFLANFQQKKIGPCSFTTVVFAKKSPQKVGFSFNLNSLQDRVLEYAQHSWLTIAYIIIIMKISDVRHKCQKISNDIIVCYNKLKQCRKQRNEIDCFKSYIHEISILFLICKKANTFCMSLNSCRYLRKLLVKETRIM